MAKTECIELDDGKWTTRIPILYEDRSVIAIDKPAGWLLVPFSWQQTRRNLHAAIVSSIAAKDFWARGRNLKFLRHVHRLDAETTGVLLMATSMGSLNTYGDLFESREMEKRYLAVVLGTPKKDQWICRQKLAQDPDRYGKMRVDERDGKEAETEFRVLERMKDLALIEARPYTGRTHQIRLHLLASGHPVMGDDLYGPDAGRKPYRGQQPEREFSLALRAVELAYKNPFTSRQVRITAPTAGFLRAFGFRPNAGGKDPAPLTPA